MTQPIKIAYILSVGHSGSSLLDVLLGDSDGAVSIGEMKLNRQGMLGNTKCTCGQSIQDCEFWQQVEENLGVYGQSMFSIRFAGGLTALDQQNVVRFYQAILDTSGAKLVIDSSKSIARLRAMSQLDSQIDVQLIFLERSPWGVVASNLRKGRNWIKHTFMYLINNTSRRHFATFYPNFHAHYEEISENPGRITADIYQFLDFKADNTTPDGSNSTSKRHMLGGNSMLYRPILKIKPDTRWKTELSKFQKLFIGTVCHPIIQRISFITISSIRRVKKKFFF